MDHSPFTQHDLYVSPKGNDLWTGRLPDPDPAGKDGPLASLGRARQIIQEKKTAGKLSATMTVWLRGGTYPLTSPLEFTPADSAPVTYSAYPGEEPVLEGGKRISGWRVEARNGQIVWVADLEGFRYFRQLFVNGERRMRARLPKVDMIHAHNQQPQQFYQMEDVPEINFQCELFDGSNSFISAAGDVQNWKYINEIEVVVPHYWTVERMPIASYNEETRLVTSSLRSIFSLRDDYVERWAKYYLDNVFEALSEPGEWYLERLPRAHGEALRLHYIPMPGETPEQTEVVAPQIEQLLRLSGSPDEGQYVEYLRFQGLAFRYADWSPILYDSLDHPNLKDVKFAAATQGAYNLPGVIVLEGARYCVFEGCSVEHVGFHAFELRDGCQANRLVGNHLVDLGGGGILMNGSDADGSLARRTTNNRITDNHIHHGGRVFHSALGVLVCHASGSTISHNHIHDFFYSAISCGWVWGYAESVTKKNRIEKNHLHDLGHGWLSDMGGVYLLGMQPDTLVRGNLIHDIEAANYGGWALYTDEGSTGVVLENNVCYHTSSQLFHQHYGHENIVRNNILAFGGEACVAMSRMDDRQGFTFERNIVITDQSPIFVGGYAANYNPGDIVSDLNVIWSVSQSALRIGRGRTNVVTSASLLPFSEWLALGFDAHSIVADPKLVSLDLDRFDWRLADDSPALRLGFKSIDLSDVGPRPKEDWD